VAKHTTEVPVHLAHQTASSRTGQVDMKNRKPFRTKVQKAMARESARKCDDGAYRSSAPVSYHPK
jgi:hypothetical protein